MAIDRELLGKSIRKMRELRGMTQAGLARKAGVQGNSVALIERGERGISMETLNLLADALDVPAACLTMLGTSKIAGQVESDSLVKSMQKLILATVIADVRMKDKERAASAKQAKVANSKRATSKNVGAARKSSTKAKRHGPLKNAKKTNATKRPMKKLEHA